MALIKWGALIVDGRGSIGGTVFSKGRSGAIARNKVTPVNPRTSFQTAIRNRLATFSTAWRNLTQAQRDAWNAAVSDFSKTNIFGDSVNPSGKNLFTSLNANLANVGVSQINTPPTPAEIPPIDSLVLAMANGAGTASVTFLPTPVPADTAYLVRMTAGLSQGRQFVSSSLRQVAVLDAAETSPYDIADEYESKFGSIPAIGTKVFIELIAVNKVTGQKGTPLSSYVIITA